MALEPLFTGLVTGTSAYLGTGPYAFPLTGLQETDRIYFTWLVAIENGSVVIDSPSTEPSDVTIHLTSKPCVYSVQDLKKGVRIYATDMFQNVVNYEDECITAKFVENTLSLSYLSAGGVVAKNTLIDWTKIPENLGARRTVVSIGPFYKIL